MRLSTTAIVLVHYGKPETTKRCLERLASVAPESLVVVSNNAGREHAEELASFAENSLEVNSLLTEFEDISESWDKRGGVVVLHNCGNRGFAAGCNSGIRLVRSLGGFNAVWLLNNDTRPEQGAVEALLTTLAASPKSILGATVVHGGEAGQRIQVAGGVQYTPWLSRIEPNHAGTRLEDMAGLSNLPMDYVYGASLFVPMSLFDDIGLLDEKFFLFYEELDLCLRAKAAGYSLGWCRECIVNHDVSASIGRPETASHHQGRTAAYHEARSTFLFTRKHYPWLLPPVLLLRSLLKPALLALRGEWHCIGPALSGLWAGG